MQKFIMFSDVPASAQIMYPNGTTKTKDEVIKDYPVLGTSIGVIGITTDDKGTVGDLIMMGYYDNINSFVDCYASQGAQITDDMTNAQKCEAITEFVKNPTSEADEAVDAYLNM